MRWDGMVRVTLVRRRTGRESPTSTRLFCWWLPATLPRLQPPPPAKNRLRLLFARVATHHRD